MQCTRCKSIVADTAALCPNCGNALGPIDSYGVTSFAPVLPAPQPAAHVSVRAPSQQPVEQLGVASTMMSSSVASPPTMASNSPQPASPYGATSPRYIVTPAQPQPPIQPAPPTMHSGVPGAIAPSNPMPNAMMPYGPPQQPPVVYSQPYPMMMPPAVAEPTPGLAIAALICGLLGWIPFWIGFILCLLAITFGGIVIGNTRPGQAGRGLAITGLVFGLVLLLPAACGL